jgi:hypothetical protein
LKKSFVICPYCKDEKTISGMTMHVKVKHPDKFEEFKKNFDELKKTAVIKDSGTRTPPPQGKEPDKIEDKPEDKHPPEASKPKDEPKVGDDKPPQGNSFLKDFDRWCDSPDL